MYVYIYACKYMCVYLYMYICVYCVSLYVNICVYIYICTFVCIVCLCVFLSLSLSLSVLQPSLPGAGARKGSGYSCENLLQVRRREPHGLSQTKHRGTSGTYVFSSYGLCSPHGMHRMCSPNAHTNQTRVYLRHSTTKL